MDQYEAASFYKVDRYEVQALVEAGELCNVCYEQVGDCEHTGPECERCGEKSPQEEIVWGACITCRDSGAITPEEMTDEQYRHYRVARHKHFL